MGRYVTNLVQEIVSMDPPDLHLKTICLPSDQPPDGADVDIMHGISSHAKPNTIKQHMVLPPRLTWYRRDIYHYPSFDPPIHGGGLMVVTCHDLEPLIMPHLFARKITCYYRLFSLRLRQANMVICISENTARDVVEILGVDKSRIKVIYHGVEERFRPLDRSENFLELRRRFHLPEDFVLYVGNTMPHKNLDSLIQAMAIVWARFPSVHLVIAGARDKYRPQVMRTIEKFRFTKKVIFLDKVPEKDLPFLYNMAKVFAFPSFYEGFGLPVLEAMACGTPVVSANASSLPEVVGGGGVLVDPANIEGFAEAITKILDDKDEAKRLSQAAIIQAARFTWKQCATQHLEVYRELLSKEAN